MNGVVLFGWPAVSLSLVCTGAGIALRRAGVVLAGSILAMPFLLYLTATTRFRYVAPVVGLLYLAAARAVATRRLRTAWALWAPFAILAVWLASQVVTQ